MLARCRCTLQLLLVALAVLCLAESAWACPGCKEALSKQSNGANLVAGYQYSILFMMAMPFTLLGLFGGYFYWEVRRARAQQAAEAARTGNAAGVQPGTTLRAPEAQPVAALKD